MLLVSGMCMSNAETQTDLLCCCHSSQNTIAEHELSDNLTRRVQLCSTKCCTASLTTLQCLLSMPWCRWICLGSEACTAFHEAVCHDAGRPPARALPQRVLADTFWVQLPCLLASSFFTQTHSYMHCACVSAMYGKPGKTYGLCLHAYLPTSAVYLLCTISHAMLVNCISIQ